MSTSIVEQRRSSAGIIAVSASVFLVAASIGAATTTWKAAPEPVVATAPSTSDSETVARLKDYARTIGVGGGAPAAAPGHAAPSTGAPKMQPDVVTMIDRLAARLATTPDDVKGWRMLGWSYYHMERYSDAADALAKAVALDPASEDLKTLLAEAKKAAAGAGAIATSPPHLADSGTGHRGPTPEQMQAMAEMPAQERQVSIRAMVDGLAARLESDPRDVEGWTRLMRSRVVLGEADVANAALRKALAAFKDDASAAGRIAAAARELGLKVE